jgi:hypothetical protein
VHLLWSLWWDARVTGIRTSVTRSRFCSFEKGLVLLEQCQCGYRDDTHSTCSLLPCDYVIIANQTYLRKRYVDHAESSEDEQKSQGLLLLRFYYCCTIWGHVNILVRAGCCRLFARPLALVRFAGVPCGILRCSCFIQNPMMVLFGDLGPVVMVVGGSSSISLIYKERAVT